MTKIRFVKIIAVMMMLVLTVGCTSTKQETKSDTVGTKEEKNSITICESWGFETGFSTVVLEESLGLFFYLSNFYETLVNYENGEIVPGLAKSWETNGNTITFHLRDNVKFSDGTPFDAEVVKMNFEMIPKMLGERYIGVYGKVLTLIDQVEVVDTYTVKLELSKPYYGALQDLTMVRPMGMMSPGAFTEEGDSDKLLTSTMGTGPYMLDSIVEGQSYTFIKNPHYWGEEPDIDEFTIKVIPDNESKALALRSGEIDMIIGADKIGYDSFNEFKQDKKYEAKISNVDKKTRYFVFNTGMAPFNDKNVRLAANYALNKQVICDNLLNGIETKADTLLSPSLPYCQVNLVPYEYDKEKAKALLDEAGWIENSQGIRAKDGTKLEGEIVYRSGMGVEEDIAITFAAALKEIGFDVTTTGVEMMTWYTDLAQGNFTIGYNETYGIPYDPYTTINNMSSMGADPAAKHVLPQNEEIDNKITKLLSMTDENTIRDTYKLVLTTVHDQSASIPISYMKELVVFNGEKISEYRFNGQPSNIDIKGVVLK